MNRRKKEADQHKGWNISISGVFIAMVMGIVLISVVAGNAYFCSDLPECNGAKCSDKQFPEL